MKQITKKLIKAKHLFWIYFYKIMGKLVGMERCKKREPLKPMGIGKSIYPPDYTPVQKRTFSDGTEEYFIPVDAQKRMDEAWKKMGIDLINPEGTSMITKIKKDDKEI